MRKFRKWAALACAIALGLTACEGDDSRQVLPEDVAAESSPPPAQQPASPRVSEWESPFTGQRFRIHHAYELFPAYLEQAPSFSMTDKVALYKKTVMQPLYDACFKETEWTGEMMYPTYPPEDETLYRGYADFTSVEPMIGWMTEALNAASDALPAEGTTNVCVFPLPDGYAMNNYNVLAVGSGKIYVFYDSTPDAFILQSSLTHEYLYSTYLAQGTDPYFSVLDVFVTKGKAVYFENMLYPSDIEDYLLVDGTPEQWEEIVPYLSEPNDWLIQRILTGESIWPPTYIASEGYRMVKAYLRKHPGLDVGSLLQVPSEAIYKESGYPYLEEERANTAI